MKKTWICAILAGVMLLSACGKKEDLSDGVKPLKVEITAETEDLSFERIQEMNGAALEVGVNPETGGIRELRGKFSTVNVRNPEDALLALMSVRTVMGIAGHEFSCARIDEEADQRTYWLQQLYKGVPVDRGLFRLVVSSAGEPQFVRGTYEEGIELEVKPALDADAALKKYGAEDSVKETSLVIYSAPGISPTLAWKYLANVGTAKEKYLFLDANTGELLEDRALIIE